MQIEDMIDTVVQGDCLEIMKQMPDKCVDLVLTDPPYGITNNNWDTTKDLPVIFDECFRVLKDNGGLVFTASEPFNYEMYFLLKKWFRHSWVWDKDFPGSFMNARFQPLKVHESIMVFSKDKVNYYPMMKTQPMRKKGKKSKLTDNYGGLKYGVETTWDKLFPKSIIRFFNGKQKGKTHPTQKPEELMSYLVSTYSLKDELVLDPFLGSGTTAIAAKKLGRHFIGIEISEKYCEIARDRLRQGVLI